jgi:hypothetical protein
MAKIIGGTPQPGNPATQIVVSANVNADGKRPAPKIDGDRIINGSPQPGGPSPSRIVSHSAKA